MLPIIFKRFNRIVISTAAHIIIQITFFNLLTRHIYTITLATMTMKFSELKFV